MNLKILWFLFKNRNLKYGSDDGFRTRSEVEPGGHWSVGGTGRRDFMIIVLVRPSSDSTRRLQLARNFRGAVANNIPKEIFNWKLIRTRSTVPLWSRDSGLWSRDMIKKFSSESTAQYPDYTPPADWRLVSQFPFHDDFTINEQGQSTASILPVLLSLSHWRTQSEM